MLDNTKIKKKVEIKDFLTFFKDYSFEDLECTEHTFFRLSERQRKIFTCNELKRILIKETPFLAGLQYNDNYALFYTYNNKNLKMIVNFENRKVKIVTFYFIEQWQIPKI